MRRAVSILLLLVNPDLIVTTGQIHGGVQLLTLRVKTPLSTPSQVVIPLSHHGCKRGKGLTSLQYNMAVSSFTNVSPNTSKSEKIFKMPQDVTALFLYNQRTVYL